MLRFDPGITLTLHAGFHQLNVHFSLRYYYILYYCCLLQQSFEHFNDFLSHILRFYFSAKILRPQALPALLRTV